MGDISPNIVQDFPTTKHTRLKVVGSQKGASMESSVPAPDLDRIAPTPRFNNSLQSLDETIPESFEDDTLSIATGATGYISESQTKKLKKVKGKMNRLRNVKALQEEATKLAHTGREEEAQKIYKNAIQIAGSEIGRINYKIKKSQNRHEAARASIQSRLREDLRKVGIVIGKIRTKMAILYERSGDYKSSVACCREAIDIHMHQPMVNENENGSSSKELIDLMQLMVERLESAAKALATRPSMLRQISELRRQITGTNEPKQKRNLYERIEMLAGKVQQMEIGALGDAHPQVADTLQLLSTIMLEQDKEKEAILYLQRAIKISTVSLGTRHPRTGQYHLRLARIHLSKELETLALSSFDEATKILAHSPKFARVLGATFNDVAVIFMRRQQYDHAITNLNNALTNYGRSREHTRDPTCSTSPEGSLEIDSLQVYQNLGDCFMKKADFGNAKKAFDMVLELQRDARKVYDIVRDLDLDTLGVQKTILPLIEDQSISDTLMLLGRVAAAAEDHKEAIRCFQEAVDILQDIVIEEELISDVFCSQTKRLRRARQDTLSKALYCIGEESCAIGNHAEALQAYGESLRLRCLSARSHQEIQASVFHCILCFAGIADVHFKLKKYDIAHKRLRESLKYCLNNGVPEQHPLYAMVEQKMKTVETVMSRDAPKRRKRIEELENRAEKQLGLENEDALATLKTSLSLRKVALTSARASGADTTEERSGIANVLTTVGKIFMKIGDEENSGRAYSEAVRLYKKSGGYDPNAF